MKYRVQITRPDGTKAWLSDTDNGRAIWEGSFEEATYYANLRQRFYGDSGFTYEVIWVDDANQTPIPAIPTSEQT